MDNGLQVVSIAGRSPDFFKGPKYLSFAPEYGMFMDWKKGRIDNFEYTKIFKERLNSLDIHAVKRFLTSFDKDVVLLCYEKPGDFCHRHIVADWLEENLGFVVEEYDVNNLKKEQELIRYISYNTCSLNELTNMFDIDVTAVLKKLEEHAPEGMFLLHSNDKYSLENVKEYLAEYGIDT